MKIHILFILVSAILSALAVLLIRIYSFRTSSFRRSRLALHSGMIVIEKDLQDTSASCRIGATIIEFKIRDLDYKRVERNSFCA